MPKIIKGITACQGNAEGQVFIVTDDNLSDFPANSILVTKMTKPEYVPAMIMASGIITDMGGVTSHAAIISREIGVPCIIATKNATEVLKSGMKVVINTDTGEVEFDE